MDDLSRIATVTAIAVAVGATIGGMKGWDVGSSAAEKRIEESPLKRELLERRAAAEEEIDNHRHSATADCERTLRKLESDFTAWRNLEETRLFERRLAGESELSSLKRKRDNLRVWTTSSDDSTDQNSVTESDVRTVRDRFKKWLLEERAEESAVIGENETIASKCAEVLAKMERTATAKGTKAKDEPGWAEVKNRMETADATIRKKREILEEEFIKLETGKCLNQAKGLLEGTDDEPGLAARLKTLRENAEDLLAELDRHLKTDEERADDEAPTMMEKATEAVSAATGKTAEAVSSAAGKTAAAVSSGFSWAKTSVTGLFGKSEREKEASADDAITTTGSENGDGDGEKE